MSETNQLTERLAEMTRAGEAAKNPVYVELTRHLGFEYGGMILHEYYFDNLSPKGKASRELTQTIDRSFGDFETWRTDFGAIGGMRGMGWAVCSATRTPGSWVGERLTRTGRTGK